MKIPDDVRAWVRSVFRACNVRTANALSTMPNTHETALDLAFVAEAGRFAAPVRLPSEWIVRVDTHFLGGGRHFGEWEIADIGILIQFRRAGKVVKSKVLLLQSKRLYPVEQDYEEDERADYVIGFARLFRGNTNFPTITGPRVFAFGDTSKYAALKVNDKQFKAIGDYESRFGIPVHYMLYHPAEIPSTVEVPLAGAVVEGDNVTEGARVLPAMQLRDALAAKPDEYSPTYADVKDLRPEPWNTADQPPGWRVEHFIADLAVDCHVGHVATKESDAGLNRIFNLRSGPISAAIAVTFDAPPGADIE